jgi:hypothetical protein
MFYLKLKEKKFINKKKAPSFNSNSLTTSNKKTTQEMEYSGHNSLATDQHMRLL